MSIDCSTTATKTKIIIFEIPPLFLLPFIYFSDHREAEEELLTIETWLIDRTKAHQSFNDCVIFQSKTKINGLDEKCQLRVRNRDLFMGTCAANTYTNAMPILRRKYDGMASFIEKREIHQRSVAIYSNWKCQ